MSNLPHFCVISIPVLEAERVFSPVLIQLLISYIDICHLMYQVYRNILHFLYHIYNLHYHPHHIDILSKRKERKLIKSLLLGKLEAYSVLESMYLWLHITWITK